MTSSYVPEELIQKDAVKMITATQRALITKVTHAQDIVHLIARKKKSDAPSQMIQLLDAPCLHCAFQNRKIITQIIAIINNVHLSAILIASNCALDSKTIWDAILLMNAFQTVSKPAQFNVPMMKSNAKVTLIAKQTVLIKICAKPKPKMSMVMPVQMTLLLMDVQSTAVEILSCVRLRRML